ncbi:MAG: 50S ribosomal protein L15 [Candidatus Babeliales bacterium]
MFQLNQLAKLVKKRKRIGRGGSRGGTSGRGGKGQTARTGHSGVGLGFEGGQTPLARHVPKRGFNNERFATSYAIVNLRDLERCFNDGDEVSLQSLKASGVIRVRKGAPAAQQFKVLGMGALTKKLTITGALVSESARQAIEKAGGKVVHS